MEEALKQLEKFHGHLGPYVVIGYKMGLISNHFLGEDSFSKKAIVWTGLKPPISCIIDGIQLSSGCTLGKGNIEVNNGNIPKVEFRGKTGSKLEILLKNEIRNEIDTTVNEDNIIEYSKKIYNKKDDELFKIVR